MASFGKLMLGIFPIYEVDHVARQLQNQ